MFLFEFSCFSWVYVCTRRCCCFHGLFMILGACVPRTARHGKFAYYFFFHRSTTFMAFFISLKIMIATTADLSIYPFRIHTHASTSMRCSRIVSAYIYIYPSIHKRYTHNKAYVYRWVHSWLFPMELCVRCVVCCLNWQAAGSRSRSAVLSQSHVSFIFAVYSLTLTNTWLLYAVRFLYL